MMVSLIVTFHDWAPHSELSTAIGVALDSILPRTSWIVRELSHRMQMLPSDFVAIELKGVSSPTCRLVRQALRRHHHVRSVTRERVYGSTDRKQSVSRSRNARLPPSRMLEVAATSAAESAVMDPTPHDFITKKLDAARWWDRGISGKGIRVAIMDTGLKRNQTFIR